MMVIVLLGHENGWLKKAWDEANREGLQEEIGGEEDNAAVVWRKDSNCAKPVNTGV